MPGIFNRAVNLLTLEAAIELLQGALQIDATPRAKRSTDEHFTPEDFAQWPHMDGVDRADVLQPWLREELNSAGFDGPVVSQDVAPEDRLPRVRVPHWRD